MPARTRTVLLVALLVAAVAAPVAAVADADPHRLDDSERLAGAAGVASAPRAPSHGATSSDSTPLACEFPHSKTDATGTRVTVESEPGRIVTLAPSAAQTMWEIGGREKVVGVTQYASYLDGAESRTNVSGAGESWVNVEKVLGLEPDLVLAPDVIDNGTVDALRRAGLTVYKFREPHSIDDVRRQTLRTGQLVGECDGAEQTVAWMDEKLRTVREAVRGQERPRVLYVFFDYTAGEGTFVDEMITTAGGVNVAAEAGISGFKQISPEIVAQRNPEWIVVNDGATGVPETAAYNNTDAVENGRIVVVKEEHVSQSAPRMVIAVSQLARAFHPEAYERAANRTTAATDDSASTTAGSETASSSRAPGFGVEATLAALVSALALLAFRRR